MKDFIKEVAPSPPPPPRKVIEREYPGYLAGLLNATLSDLPNIPEKEMQVYEEYFAEQCRHSFRRQIGMEEQDWRLRPSGQKCSLGEWYKRTGEPLYATDTGSHGTFMAGDIVEAFTVTMLAIAGVETFGHQQEVLIPTPFGTTTGSIDLRARHLGKVFTVDVKSATGYGIRDAKAGYVRDPWGYKDQLKVYDMADMDPPNDFSLLLFFSKETWREWVEVLVPNHTLKDKSRWFKHCQTAMKITTPTKPEWATTKKRPRLGLTQIEDLRCCYCDYVKSCYPGAYIRTPGKKDWHIG